MRPMFIFCVFYMPYYAPFLKRVFNASITRNAGYDNLDVGIFEPARPNAYDISPNNRGENAPNVATPDGLALNALALNAAPPAATARTGSRGINC